MISKTRRFQQVNTESTQLSRQLINIRPDQLTCKRLQHRLIWWNKMEYTGNQKTAPSKASNQCIRQDIYQYSTALRVNWIAKDAVVEMACNKWCDALVPHRRRDDAAASALTLKIRGRSGCHTDHSRYVDDRGRLPGICMSMLFGAEENWWGIEWSWNRKNKQCCPGGKSEPF